MHGSAKFVLSGEGTIMIDGNGVRAGDEEADVTLTADADASSSQILEGELNPTAAFMTGQLTVDGDMGIAMQLANVLVLSGSRDGAQLPSFYDIAEAPEGASAHSG